MVATKRPKAQPLHALEAATDWNVPSGQAVQAVDAAAEYRPAAHAVQLDAPVATW